jgi:hypothetical protein
MTRRITASSTSAGSVGSKLGLVATSVSSISGRSR